MLSSRLPLESLSIGCRPMLWLDQIEWFSVLQRKLLTPCHFDSLEDLAQAIMEFIRCENLSPKPIQWTYTVEKLEKKLGTI
jgi:hypothetical protein